MPDRDPHRDALEAAHARIETLEARAGGLRRGVTRTHTLPREVVGDHARTQRRGYSLPASVGIGQLVWAVA